MQARILPGGPKEIMEQNTLDNIERALHIRTQGQATGYYWEYNGDIVSVDGEFYFSNTKRARIKMNWLLDRVVGYRQGTTTRKELEDSKLIRLVRL